MLKYKGLYYDDFDTEVVCWLDVSGVPEKFIHEAKQADGDNYSSGCFGVCLLYDKGRKEFTVAGDKTGHDLYYVDNNGDKQWFPYQLSEIEIGLLAQKAKQDIEPDKPRESRKTEHQR